MKNPPSHTTLATYFDDHPSIFLPPQEDTILPYDAWKQAGKPHVWVPIEEHSGYLVWIDTGYGYLALTHGDTLLGVGNHSIVAPEGHPHIAVLDRDYYSTPSYLYRTL